MKKCYTQYKHIVPAILFFVIYIIWFIWIENRNVEQLHIIHMKADDYIPFCEWFVIPYFMWFAYVAVTLIYLCFTEKQSYMNACIFLFTGMFAFLIISTVYPNGHTLRPEIMPRDNLLTQLVSSLYLTDTPTNILPSIHVYNAVGTHLAIIKSNRLSSRKRLHAASLILCILIILSTVLIKQHSLLDVLSALFLAGVMYLVVYRFKLLQSIKFKKSLADPVSVD